MQPLVLLCAEAGDSGVSGAVRSEGLRNFGESPRQILDGAERGMYEACRRRLADVANITVSRVEVDCAAV